MDKRDLKRLMHTVLCVITRMAENIEDEKDDAETISAYSAAASAEGIVWDGRAEILQAFHLALEDMEDE